MKRSLALSTLAFSLFIGWATSIQAANNPVDTDEKLKKRISGHFKFWNEKDLKRRDFDIILKNLDDVRRDVGKDFNTYPTKKLEVIVTSGSTFEEYSGESKRHVAGLYDGKIHLPVPSQVRSKKRFQSTLWHEYTHAIVHLRTKGICPVWLNEGLAEYQEAKIIPQNRSDLKQLLNDEEKLPFTIDELNAIFYGRNSVSQYQIHLAYQQSHAIVAYLYKRYRKGGVLKLLDNIREKRNFEVALQKTFKISPETLVKKAALFAKKL